MLRVLLALLLAVVSSMPGDAAAAVLQDGVNIEQIDDDCCPACPSGESDDDCCEEGCGACCAPGGAALTASFTALPAVSTVWERVLTHGSPPTNHPLATGPPPTPPPIG